MSKRSERKKPFPVHIIALPIMLDTYAQVRLRTPVDRATVLVSVLADDNHGTPRLGGGINFNNFVCVCRCVRKG